MYKHLNKEDPELVVGEALETLWTEIYNDVRGIKALIVHYNAELLSGISWLNPWEILVILALVGIVGKYIL